MRVLVLGSTGMAGSMITRYLRDQGHTVFAGSRDGDGYEEFAHGDAVDYKAFGARVKQFCKTDFIHFVVNCIGVLVKEAEEDPVRAVLVNGVMPHQLREDLWGLKTTIIHISTDCVFDGSKGPYNEFANPSETKPYGASKAYGELKGPKDVTIRTSIIGPEYRENATGLFDWFVNKTGSEVDGWTNAYWNGITTLELAKAIEAYMQFPHVSGVHHVTSPKHISKWQVLKMLTQSLELNKEVNRVALPKQVNKVLVNTQKTFPYEVSGFAKQLRELKEYLKNIS